MISLPTRLGHLPGSPLPGPSVAWWQQCLRWCFLWGLALWLVMPLRANAPRTLPVTGERLALVIGNSSYASAPLLNPGNDAKAIAALLHNAGFRVNLLLDANTIEMQQAVQKLAREQREAKVKTVLFYYAGHAVQVDWRNYLIGTEANIRNIDQLPESSVDVADIVDNFGAANKEGRKQLVMVLDACRDNPFRKELNLSQKGMSQFDAPPNTLVAFSTAPGKVALDGDGVNSYYTGSLLRELSIPYVSLEDAFKRVRMGVRVASLDRQIPWESTSLEQRFYLFPAEGGESTLTADALESSIKRELTAWTQAKSGNDVASLVGFLQDFPNGNFSQLAQFRLDEMLRQRAHEEAIVVAQRQRGLEDEQQRAELAMIKAAQEQRRQEQLQAQAEAERQRLAQEQERVQRERERVEQERLQQERLAQERQAREAAAHALAQRQAQAERERLALEQARQAQERLEREAAARDLAARQAQAELRAQEQSRLEQERRDREAAARRAQEQEQQRLAQERAVLEKAQQQAAAAGAAPLPAAQEPLWLAAQKMNTPLVAPLAVLAQIPPLTEQHLAPVPGFSGADALGRVFRVGDAWAYQTLDRFTRQQGTMELRVTEVNRAADRVTYNNGQFYADLMGNATSTTMGALDSPRQFYPAMLQLGQKWVTSFMQKQNQGIQRFRYDVRVVAKENIRVPAGQFLSYRIEALGYNLDNGTTMRRIMWVTPGINANIALEVEVRTRDGRVDQTYRWELMRYTPVSTGLS